MSAAGRPRMATKAPLGFAGSRPIHQGPGGGLPHDQAVYDTVEAAVNQHMTTRQMKDLAPLRGMTTRGLNHVAKRVRGEGGTEPGRHGTHGNHKRTITDAHIDFLLEQMNQGGAGITLAWMCYMLEMRFGVKVTEGGLHKALTRHRISWKKLTKMNKLAFTPAVVEWTRRVRRAFATRRVSRTTSSDCTTDSCYPAPPTAHQFLIRRTAVDPDTVVSVDEMQYKSHDVGTAYGWAPSNRRAIQIDDGKGTGESVMFIAAMSTTEVLPITFPVPSPLTVKGFLFEFWCMHFLIPAMRARGKRIVILDNAKPHRRMLLRILFWAADMEVWFLPPYSPWFQPIEKTFLSTHMKCSQRKEWTRDDFIRRVVETLHGHTAAQCRGFFEVTGWF